MNFHNLILYCYILLCVWFFYRKRPKQNKSLGPWVNSMGKGCIYLLHTILMNDFSKVALSSQFHWKLQLIIFFHFERKKCNFFTAYCWFALDYYWFIWILKVNKTGTEQTERRWHFFPLLFLYVWGCQDITTLMTCFPNILWSRSVSLNCKIGNWVLKMSHEFWSKINTK